MVNVSVLAYLKIRNGERSESGWPRMIGSASSSNIVQVDMILVFPSDVALIPDLLFLTSGGKAGTGGTVEESFMFASSGP